MWSSSRPTNTSFRIPQIGRATRRGIRNGLAVSEQSLIFENGLSALVRDVVGRSASLRILRHDSWVGEGPALFLVEDRAFKSILHLSPAAFPDEVARGCEKARAFHARFGLEPASPILLPLHEGRHARRSYAILPYRLPHSQFPLIGRLQRARLRPSLLDWLAGLASLADTEVALEHRLGAYRDNLNALAELAQGVPLVRNAIGEALARLDGGAIEPQFVPMHGNLLAGNILSARNRDSYPFALIDWRASETSGYPIFDLIRFAHSYRLPARRLRGQLERHAQILGCAIDDTRVHLLAGIGHFAVHRGDMSIAALLEMAALCLATHGAAVRGAYS